MTGTTLFDDLGNQQANIEKINRKALKKKRKHRLSLPPPPPRKPSEPRPTSLYSSNSKSFLFEEEERDSPVMLTETTPVGILEHSDRHFDDEEEFEKSEPRKEFRSFDEKIVYFMRYFGTM